jgi:hypothetical protein
MSKFLKVFAITATIVFSSVSSIYANGDPTNETKAIEDAGKKIEKLF